MSGTRQPRRRAPGSAGARPTKVAHPSGAFPVIRPDGARDRYLNRELAWLDFNARVLEEALDAAVPLLERVKFLAIFSSNLDEFFMVRLAGLKRQVDAGVEVGGPDGLSPRATIELLSKRLHDLVALQHRCFERDIRPALEQEGVHLVEEAGLDPIQRAFLADYFRRTILPVVTPLAIDPGHPFPHLANRTICLAVGLRPKS